MTNQAVTKVYPVFANVQYVRRRAGGTGYALEWVVRGSGGVVYRSKTCNTQDEASLLALAWLAKHPDYKDTTESSFSAGSYRGPGRSLQMSPLMKLHHGLAVELRQSARTSKERGLVAACNRFMKGDATAKDKTSMREAAWRLLGKNVLQMSDTFPSGAMRPKAKVCRRCKLAKIKPTWPCRVCGALCCQHLCAFKSQLGIMQSPLATCGKCCKQPMCMADKFPESLPGFQKMFPDDATCALYLESIRWREGFVCPKCASTAAPTRIAKPGVLRCKGCKRDIALTAGTVMERTHMPLSTWFWAAFLVASLTPGMSAVQLQRQLGIKSYETAFQILHKLRSSMAVTSGRIGIKTHVEIDETWVGGRTRGKGKGIHDQIAVIGAVEVKQRVIVPEREDGKGKPRRGGRYAGRLRLAVAPDRTAKTLCGFVESNVDPATEMVVTDAWQGYAPLARMGYQHLACPERGEPDVAEDYLPIIHLIFSNLKAWLNGVHHGVSPKHLQAYLNEFVFRFNRRFYPFNAFRSLLGLSVDTESPTYAELYDGDWQHPTTTLVS